MTLRLRIFIFNLVTVATAFALITIIGYKTLESTVVENTYEKLNLIRLEKTRSIENYFRDIITASNLIATNESVLKLMTQKKFPSDSLQKVDEYVKNFNLLDLILIRKDGTLVHSSGPDFKQIKNLEAPRESLGKLPELYKWGMKATPGSFLLLDFDDEKNQDQQAISYLASPLFRDNKRIGLLVFRMSMGQIDQLTSDHFDWSNHGLGATGETLIYGEDWSLRNKSRFRSTTEGLVNNRGNEDFNRLNEFKEIQESGTDYRGVSVFRSLGKLYLPNGDSWYIQVKIDESEAFYAFRRLLLAASATTFAITMVFFLLSYAATKKIISPIQLLIERFESLGTDNLSQKINYQSTDEIGTMVSKYNDLAERLEKTTVSKEFLDSVIASLKEYIFIVRVDKNLPDRHAPYRILQANDSALDALSISGFDVIGKDLRELISGPAALKDYAWLLSKRHSVEADLLTPTGNKIPILVNWSLLPEQRSNDLIFVFACTDITDTRANEMALIKAREQAINASMAKSEFLARMSHEIRTPLNALIGMTDVLKDSGLNSEQKSMLAISSNAGENLLAIINDILDLSKIEARQVVIEKIPFNVFELVKNVCEILAQKAKEKSLDFKVNVQIPAHTFVIGDPTRIRQVLLNLIGNAIKFTEAGRIEIELQKTASGYEFTVRDSGSGIPSDKHHLIFKNFSQADSSITRKYGGTGLGLAISKNLVELMGGHITFTSQVDQGSTFTFMLPLVSLERTQTENLLSKNKFTERHLAFAKKLRILVVDDTEDNRYLIKAYLKKQNFEILDAANGKEALDMVIADPFDLIFMDVQMPVMDGYAATRKIREIETASHREKSLIIALSANALSEDIQNSYQAGCDDYLAKPIKKDVLYQILEKYFS